VQVFLVRHADAVNASQRLGDSDRHLSEAGRAAALAMGERLKWYDCTPTALWTSPLIRAIQTAELFATAMQWKGVIECEPDLAPGGQVREVMDRLADFPESASIMLFGHEPGISGLGTLITGRHDFPGMKKTQVVRIDDGIMRWSFSTDDAAPVPAPDH
jgi:phosphohistidine phosphatase